MTGYSPHAYRILLTDRDLSKSKYVREYDPCSNKGPLREKNGDWYWNGSYTSEFMVEGDIDLDECTGFDFVSHHSDICRLDGASCPDRSATTSRIGGRILAFMLGHSLHTIDRVLKCSSQSRRPLHDAVDTGADGIMRAIGIKTKRFGGAIKSSTSAQAVLRGALALYGSGNVTAAHELIRLLSSPIIFEKALTEIVNEHFGTTCWTIPD
jgi:hypothetical protein